MIKTFDMRFIRYINMFERVTRVSPKHCFEYNNMLVFIVPAKFVMMAIGRNNSNLEQLSNIFSKRIRIIAEPRSSNDLQDFILRLISPVKFDKLELKEGELTITSGGMENKAMLIGRNKVRLEELKDILKQNFDVKDVRIA